MIKEDNASTPAFRTARWIWPESNTWDLRNSYALFRRTFQLEKVPEQAPLLITADQSYQLYVNGVFVCRGPARGFQKSWPFDEVDLVRFLKTGKNVIAIRAFHPGSGSFFYISEGTAGLLVEAPWPKEPIVSDGSWKCCRQPGIIRDTVPASLMLFPQEHIDNRLEPQNWHTLEFDDTLWPATYAEVAIGAQPWHSLERRGIPLLAEEDYKDYRVIGTAHGRSAEGYRNTRDVAGICAKEAISHTPCCAALPSLIPPGGHGQYRSFLIDMGKVMVGNWTLTLKHATGGEMIDFVFGEVIETATLTLTQLYPTHARIALANRLICRKGEQTHRFYHHYGFRYCLVMIRDSETPLELDMVFNPVSYPIRREGRFRSSEEDLNQIWEACAWTQHCCSQDAFIDTPWREQAQWWGDARVQARNFAQLSCDFRLFRRGIRQIASQTTEDGLTYGHAPTSAHSCVVPDFTLVWMITLWDYYWFTGSLDAFEEHEPILRKALTYFEGRAAANRYGLLDDDPRYWLFLDWRPVFKKGYSTLYNLWYLHALQKTGELYRLSGNDARAAQVGALEANLRQALTQCLNQDGMLCDGLTFEGKLVASASSHTQTLALLTDATFGRKEEMLEAVLGVLALDPHNKETPSAYWITHLFELLISEGYGEEVLAFIRRHWKEMAEYGSTWEDFSPAKAIYSHSHAWSAHPLFHLSRILTGITPLSKSWEVLSITPHFIGDFLEADLPTPRGLIRTQWRRTTDGILYSLTLPALTEATLFFPDGTVEKVTQGSDGTEREDSSPRLFLIAGGACIS